MTRTFVVGPGSEIVVRKTGQDYEVLLDGRAERVSVLVLSDGRLSLLFEDGRQLCGRAVRRGMEEVLVTTRGQTRAVRLADPLRARLLVAPDAAPAASESEEIRAQMPGRIVEVSVAAGDSVQSGDLLLVLEAMKMQNELRATRAGVVQRCSAAPGQTVEAGALLLMIEPVPEGEVSTARG